jgi:hypothetical protein
MSKKAKSEKEHKVKTEKAEPKVKTERKKKPVDENLPEQEKLKRQKKEKAETSDEPMRLLHFLDRGEKDPTLVPVSACLDCLQRAGFVYCVLVDELSKVNEQYHRDQGVTEFSVRCKGH